MIRSLEYRINQIADFESPAVDAIVNLMAAKKLSLVESLAPTRIGEKIYSADGVEEK